MPNLYCLFKERIKSWFCIATIVVHYVPNKSAMTENTKNWRVPHSPTTTGNAQPLLWIWLNSANVWKNLLFHPCRHGSTSLWPLPIPGNLRVVGWVATNYVTNMTMPPVWIWNFLGVLWSQLSVTLTHVRMVNAVMFLKMLPPSFTSLSPAYHVNFLSWTASLIKKHGLMLALVIETQSHVLRHCLHSARNICSDYILNIPKFVCNPEQNLNESWMNRFRLSSIQATFCKNFRWYFSLTSWLISSTDLHMKIKFSYINKLINKNFIHSITSV